MKNFSNVTGINEMQTIEELIKRYKNVIKKGNEEDVKNLMTIAFKASELSGVEWAKEQIKNSK